MNWFPPNLGSGCFSSCSTDTWYPKLWNAKKDFCDVIASVLYNAVVQTDLVANSCGNYILYSISAYVSVWSISRVWWFLKHKTSVSRVTIPFIFRREGGWVYSWSTQYPMVACPCKAAMDIVKHCPAPKVEYAKLKFPVPNFAVSRIFLFTVLFIICQGSSWVCGSHLKFLSYLILSPEISYMKKVFL